ncbi:uncharacterized protein METZ01_LOCUS149881, partial [marine metagenome]
MLGYVSCLAEKAILKLVEEYRWGEEPGIAVIQRT